MAKHPRAKPSGLTVAAWSLLVATVVTVATAVADEVPPHGDLNDQLFQDNLVGWMLEAEEKAKARFYHHDSTAAEDVQQMCYEELGCFELSPGGVFPEDPGYVDPIFHLYVQDSPAPSVLYRWNATIGGEDVETRLALSDPRRSLVFLAHGFGGSAENDWLIKLKELKMATTRYNVVTIDWRNGARYTTFYTRAAANVALVARMASRLALKMMQVYKIPAHRVEFVGFSLGAQMSGFFAREMFEATGDKIGKVTALDAAAPLFESYGLYPRKDHAHFLEALHTSAGSTVWRGKVGVQQNYGHVDYYPNGGVDQPGCSFPNMACAHIRAVDYYLEALESQGRCRYHGHPCQSVDEAQRGSCAPDKEGLVYLAMNRQMAPRFEGQAIFFMRTNASAPYCLDE